MAVYGPTTTKASLIVGKAFDEERVEEIGVRGPSFVKRPNPLYTVIRSTMVRTFRDNGVAAGPPFEELTLVMTRPAVDVFVVLQRWTSLGLLESLDQR